MELEREPGDRRERRIKGARVTNALGSRIVDGGEIEPGVGGIVVEGLDLRSDAAQHILHLPALGAREILRGRRERGDHRDADPGGRQPGYWSTQTHHCAHDPLLTCLHRAPTHVRTPYSVRASASPDAIERTMGWTPRQDRGGREHSPPRQAILT